MPSRFNIMPDSVYLLASYRTGHNTAESNE